MIERYRSEQFASVLASCYRFTDFETRRYAQYNNENYSLTPIKELLQRLGNPQNHFESIHVAGTKGKGSVVRFIADMLCKSGFKVGQYLSPHIFLENERFRLNNNTATFSQLLPHFKTVLSVAKSMVEEQQIAKRSSVKAEHRPPTVFDLFTAVAFCFFRAEKVQIAVVETGLGGRWDSTNVLSPLVSVITKIDYDHCDKLGNSLSEIAGEKAGIIKKEVPVVFWNGNAEVRETIEKKALQLKAPVFAVDKKNPMNGRFSQLLSVTEANNEVSSSEKLPAWGLENLSLATVAMMAVWKKLPFMPKQKARGKWSLEKAKSLARHAWRSAKPFARYSVHGNLVFDAAHTPASMDSLVQAVEKDRRLNCFQRIVCIFFALADKDIENMVGKIPQGWRLVFFDPQLFYLSRDYVNAVHSRVESSRGKTVPIFENYGDLRKMYSQDCLLVCTGSFKHLGQIALCEFGNEVESIVNR